LGAYLRNATVAAVYPSRNAATSALAKIDFASNGGPGTAHVLCFMAGRIGTLYVIGAPAASFAQQRSGLVRILQSFSFTGEHAVPRDGGQAAPAESRVSYSRFQDPREGSFSIDVPTGWKVDGGMIRKSTVDVRAYVFATSPDNSTLIRVGDPDIGSFIPPTQTLGMTGFREGSQYSPGYGNVMTVRRFVPGPAFAQEYAYKLARIMQASPPQFKTVKPLPQYSSTTNVGPAVRQSIAGEADFTCMRGSQEFAGTVWAQTTGTTMPGIEGGGGIWTVSILIDFLAPAGKAAATDAIVQHMVQSFQMNSSWVGQQQQTTAQTSQIVRETNEQVSRIISDTYWSRQKAQDRTNRNFDDYIRGAVRLKDPESGEELEGVSGKNYYYRVPGTNNTVGTDRTDFQVHNPDFTELEQIR